MGSKAIFEGLVVDGTGQPLQVKLVGSEAHYVIDDGGFLRHIDAEHIDREVVNVIQEQVNANKDLVEEGIMKMIGQDDLFTKAALDVSIKRMDQILERGLPEDARLWLGMMGFRVVVNVHGDIVNSNWPGAVSDEE